MSLEGGCACGEIRYRLTAAPMIVHACHCRDCQRLTGGAFALNLWIERKFVEASGGEPVAFRVPPGSSGKPHDVFACGKCSTHLWSKYHAAPGDTVLLRAGTLDDPTGSRRTCIFSPAASSPGLSCQPGHEASRRSTR